MNFDYDNSMSNTDITETDNLDLLEIIHQNQIAHLPIVLFESSEKIAEQCHNVALRKNKKFVCPICHGKTIKKDACGCVAVRKLYISMEEDIISEEERIVSEKKQEHKKRIKNYIMEEYTAKNKLPKMLDDKTLVYTYIYFSKEKMRIEIERRNKILQMRKQQL